jgi:hypothetical protein
MKKRLKKGAEEREEAREDAVVEISMDDVLELPSVWSTRDVESQAPRLKSVKAKGKVRLRQDSRCGFQRLRCR